MIRRVNRDQQDERTVEDVAADWFARERSGEMTSVERRDLDAWLAADVEHRLVYDGMQRAFLTMERFRASPELIARRERVRARYRTPRRTIRRALAACLAVAVLSGGVAWQTIGPGFGSRAFNDHAYVTAVGERTNVTLPDGSVVTLNTDTVLRTEADDDTRVLYLDKGQAFFRVAKDPQRPFVVHAAGRTVTAVGTAFDVRVDKGEFKVVLVEGKVRVAAPAPTPAERGLTPMHAALPAEQVTEMVAGSELVAVDPRSWSVTETNVTLATSWVTGRLKFDNRPLGEVAEELGRYSPRKIIIDDPAIARETVSGTFEAGDIDSFVRTVQMADLARVSSTSPTAITLTAPSR